MRVYEFSKQIQIASKDLIDALKDAGFEVSNHMSTLSPKAIDFLQKKFNRGTMLTNSGQNQAIRRKKSVISPRADTVAREKEGVASGKSELSPIIIEQMSLADAAQRVGQPANEAILTLLRWGIIANKNQILPEAIVIRLAEHFGVPFEKKSVDEPGVDLKKIADADNKKATKRLPVVVILGHVDHGKTTLMDFIRKTRVAAREKGGITQHLGAYEAETKHGNIIFLDTPGHEAFSKIRSRGARVADIAILIIAADDGIKPQTVEAIRHAKAMKLPVIVAINKIDKVDAPRIEAVKGELAQHDLLPEEWGGEIVCMPISAKLGKGVDELLEMIALQADMMELRADATGAARGYILESQLEKGRGPVATVLCQQGEIKIGDLFIAGATRGKVNSIVDSNGKLLKKVGPAVPVQVAGFEKLAQAGDAFEVVSKAEFRKASLSTLRGPASAAARFVPEGAINIIIKADTHSSKEALLGAIDKLSVRTAKEFEKEFNVLYSGIGDINESDVDLAVITGASIFALHVKKESNAATAAQHAGVKIATFDIIYKLLDRLQEVAQGARKIKYTQKKTGEAVVRRVFKIKGLGVIAGCYVKDGVFSREGSVVAWRGNQKIGEGKITSLQRDKKNVKEVHSGYECAFMIEGMDDWEVEDRVECFIEVPEK